MMMMMMKGQHITSPINGFWRFFFVSSPFAMFDIARVSTFEDGTRDKVTDEKKKKKKNART